MLLAVRNYIVAMVGSTTLCGRFVVLCKLVVFLFHLIGFSNLVDLWVIKILKSL